MTPEEESASLKQALKSIEVAEAIAYSHLEAMTKMTEAEQIAAAFTENRPRGGLEPAAILATCAVARATLALR